MKQLYRENPTDVFTLWLGAPINGIQHPSEIAEKWTANQLASIGLYEAAPADAIPANKVVASTSVKRVSGVVKYVNILEDAPRPSHDDVNRERDRRVDLGFQFLGKNYAFDKDSKQRVTGAATLAGFAMGAGAQPGNYHWHGGADPFVWIADDNTLTVMDAQTCFAFGNAAAAWESAHIFAARNIKDNMNPIPYNYTDNVYWP